MPTFGAVVFSLRDMTHLVECLKSVAWADEILLLHAGGAPEIGGGEFPSLRIRGIRSLAEAKNHFGEIGTDWVLQLWAEERVDEDLARELRALCQDRSPNASEYRIAVRSRILGEWVEGSVSGPSPALRLSRKSEEMPLGWWDEGRSVPRLARGWIEDYGCSELGRAVERVQDLSDLWAEHLREIDSPPGPMSSVFCSLKIFIKMLLRNRIFSRGIAGIALSSLASYAVLLSGAKAWEAGHVGVKRRA
jgi:hypothetical protein